MNGNAVDKDTVLDAYAQALLAATDKGIVGERAKAAARNAAARALTRVFGQPVTPETVADIVAHG